MKLKYILAPVLSLILVAQSLTVPKKARAEEGLCPGSVGATLIGGVGGAVVGGVAGGFVGRKIGMRALGPIGLVAGLVMGAEAGNKLSKDEECQRSTFKRQDGTCVLGDGRAVECPPRP